MVLYHNDTVSGDKFESYYSIGGMLIEDLTGGLAREILSVEYCRTRRTEYHRFAEFIPIAKWQIIACRLCPPPTLSLSVLYPRRFDFYIIVQKYFTVRIMPVCACRDKPHPAGTARKSIVAIEPQTG
jgi:hypothetical protein